MAWIFLVAAGLMELLWFFFFFLSHGFTQLGYSVLTVAGMVVSFLFLAQAMKTLPLGTAYAMWTGIGAVGAVIVGIVFFREAVTLPRMVFVALLLIGLLGLKATSGH